LSPFDHPLDTPGSMPFYRQGRGCQGCTSIRGPCRCDAPEGGPHLHSRSSPVDRRMVRSLSGPIAAPGRRCSLQTAAGAGVLCLWQSPGCRADTGGTGPQHGLDLEGGSSGCVAPINATIRAIFEAARLLPGSQRPCQAFAAIDFPEMVEVAATKGDSACREQRQT
jgi:hypothetical protein